MHIICCDTIGGGRSILSYNWLWPVYVVIQLAVAGLYCNKIEFDRSGLIYVVVSYKLGHACFVSFQFLLFCSGSFSLSLRYNWLVREPIVALENFLI